MKQINNNKLFAWVIKKGAAIQGGVNIVKGDKDYLQPHVKRVNPWEWTRFNTIEERATTGEQLDKLNANKTVTLGLEDYTESMAAVHHILTHTPMNKDNAKRRRLIPFTTKHLKEGLRTVMASRADRAVSDKI